MMMMNMMYRLLPLQIQGLNLGIFSGFTKGEIQNRYHRIPFLIYTIFLPLTSLLV